MVTGRIIQYRRGRHNVHDNHFLIEIDGVVGKEAAAKFVGKEVIWSSPAGKKIVGKIADVHGIKGVVRAIFEKGLPGQAITTSVEIN